jgi:NADPH:quinone reductase-like Zn-dependent oxidoreductase
VVRSDEAATQVSDAGGEHVVIDGDDLPAQLQRVLGGQELALVLDSIGGPVVTELAHLLATGARWSASAHSAAGRRRWTSART